MNLIFLVMLGALVGLIPLSVQWLFRRIHEHNIRKFPNGEIEQARSVSQVRELEVGKDYEETFQLCLESLKSLKNVVIKKEDKFEGTISAKMRVTWKRAPSTISFVLSRKSPDTTKIRMYSQPSMYIKAFKQYDFGQNYGNVERLYEYIRRHG